MKRGASKANMGKSGKLPLPPPEAPKQVITFSLELALPLGIGLSSTNVVTDTQPMADSAWQLGDRICWADGKNVKNGVLGVAAAIDRNRTHHEFVIQRYAAPKLTLIEKADVLRAKLGLAPGLPLINITALAVEQLGLGAEVADLPIPDQIDACLNHLRSLPFKISGWSNSTQVYKYVCDCEAGDAPADSASSADLPSELNIKYVKKDEFKADGKVRFVMKPTGDDQRLVALLDFFKKYDRVGQMDLEGGGVLFVIGPAAEGANALELYRTPGAFIKEVPVRPEAQWEHREFYNPNDRSTKIIRDGVLTSDGVTHPRGRWLNASTFACPMGGGTWHAQFDQTGALTGHRGGRYEEDDATVLSWGRHRREGWKEPPAAGCCVIS